MHIMNNFIIIMILVCLSYPYHKIKTFRNRKIYLLGLSFLALLTLFYYAKKQLIILFIFILTQYIFLKWLNHKRKMMWLVGTISMQSLCLMIFYKYGIVQHLWLNLFPSLSWFLKPASFLGISFIAFKVISLAIDIYRDTEKREFHFIDFVNFMIFFPTFISGPLDRFYRFAYELNRKKNFIEHEVFHHFYRIILGLFKKLVIANLLSDLSAEHFDIYFMRELPFYKGLIGMYIYTFVLYFDFSGYSDIAIGLSKLYGINTPENFNKPFMALNIQDFWNRWHITFMQFLKEYVYFPVQFFILKYFPKAFQSAAILSFFITFLMAGIWHGDKFQYFLYGLFHGLSYAFYLIYKKWAPQKIGPAKFKKWQEHRFARAASIVLTFHYFTFSLYFFIGKYPVFF